MLKNYASGLNTGVTASLTWNAGWVSLTTGSGASTGVGDEATYFGSIVNLAGTISYATNHEAEWFIDLTFTGLTAGKTYDFVTTANRNSSSSNYPQRYTKFTLSGVDSAVNGSSAGANIIDSYNTTFCTGYNPNGYVARWTNIAAGADGAFTVRFGVWDIAQAGGRGYGPSGFVLTEVDAVPEPMTLLLVGAGLIPILRRRRR